MKVLLTGATGLVGSHILDRLVERGIDVVALLRSTSNRRYVEPHRDRVTLVEGAIDDPASLIRALADVTHVIHCAGATKALRADELYRVNRDGTRNVVEAVNAGGSPVERLVHISSLAVSGPGTRAAPALEGSPPNPVSEYGRSKRAAELEITQRCRVPYVILRPGGVYGPRDREFLPLFRAARRRLAPTFGGGRQELSLVFARDLADVVVAALAPGVRPGVICHVASAEVITARQLADALARVMGVRLWTLPLPNATLTAVCAVAEAAARLTGRPTVLAHGKRHELTAPGWVADLTNMETQLKINCPTLLRVGLAATLRWYREAGWL